MCFYSERAPTVISLFFVRSVEWGRPCGGQETILLRGMRKYTAKLCEICGNSSGDLVVYEFMKSLPYVLLWCLILCLVLFAWNYFFRTHQGVWCWMFWDPHKKHAYICTVIWALVLNLFDRIFEVSLINFTIQFRRLCESVAMFIWDLTLARHFPNSVVNTWIDQAGTREHSKIPEKPQAQFHQKGTRIVSGQISGAFDFSKPLLRSPIPISTVSRLGHVACVCADAHRRRIAE